MNPFQQKTWLLALGAGLLSARASGLPAVETKLFDERARKLYDQGRYQAALEAFLLASTATPSAGSLYNVGVTADLAGERELAFAYLGQYLTLRDDDRERRQDAERRQTELRRKLALVRVESDPPGATIYVDRRELGVFGTTPCSIPLDPGRHRLELDLAGHHPGAAEVTAEPGQQTLARLALVERTGRVRVRVEPPSARVTFLREQPALEIHARPGETVLPVGTYRVRSVAPGWEPVESRVLVEEGSPAEVSLVARQLPEPTGGLLVSAGPVHALVLVDGVRKAESPATLDKVPVGRHRVELRAAGYHPWLRKVWVKRDQVIYLNATLRSIGK
jgi:hypothetical protein